MTADPYPRHSTVALAARAERLLELPPEREQLEEVQDLLVELSAAFLALERQRRAVLRGIDERYRPRVGDRAPHSAVQRFWSITHRLEEIEAVREPLRRRRELLSD